MQLIRVARLRPDLIPDPLDRAGIEPGQVAGLHRQPARDPHLPAPAVGCLRLVVQVGERLAVQDLVGEHRRLRGVARDDGDPAGLDPVEQVAQPVDVHRLVQAVR